MAHKILVSAPVPLELILTGFDWFGAGPWEFGDLGRGLTTVLFYQCPALRPNIYEPF